MSNLVLRFLTAVVLIPLLIAAIQWQNPVGVCLWVLFAQVAGLREWMAMTMPDEPRGTRFIGVIIGVGCVAAFFFGQWERVFVIPLLAVCGTTIAAFLFFLFRYQSLETVAVRVSFLLCGVLYAGVLITPLALFKLRVQGDGGGWVYLCLTTAWLSDTGAYFAGRFLGPLWPRKLWETVSPKKTVIGAFGGLLGSILAISVAKLWYLPVLSWLDVFCLAVPANVLGQFGDLCESLIKRSVGVKDSGALLPGHGGMLDRVDALLFAVPYVYAYATFFL